MVRRGRWSESGFVTVQVVAACGMATVVLVVLANLLVAQYARAVLRAAVDEGARAGARVGASVAACEDRVLQAIGDLLGGAVDVVVRCGEEPGMVVAEADARIAGWLPPVPDVRLEARAEAARAVAP